MAVSFAMEGAGRRARPDLFITAPVLLLTGLGLVTLYSASYAFAERFFGNSRYFISRQVVLAIFGFALFFVVSRMNLELLRQWILPLVIGTIILCILTFIPGIGVMKNGATRWIRLGSSTYQPSELVKLALPF
jgi:cell division protein FtsW